MTEVILGQIQFILYMLCGGMALMLGYDGFRLLRWLVPHSKLVVAVQDILYWCVMSVPAFSLFFYLHDGQIRWYGILALFSGIAIYEFGISSPIRKILYVKLEPFRYRIRRGMKKAIRAFVAFFRKWKAAMATHKNTQNKET